MVANQSIDDKDKKAMPIELKVKHGKAENWAEFNQSVQDALERNNAMFLTMETSSERVTPGFKLNVLAEQGILSKAKLNEAVSAVNVRREKENLFILPTVDDYENEGKAEKDKTLTPAPPATPAKAASISPRPAPSKSVWEVMQEEASKGEEEEEKDYEGWWKKLGGLLKKKAMNEVALSIAKEFRNLLGAQEMEMLSREY